MDMWPFSNLLPGSNYDRFNLDWIMQTLKQIPDAVTASTKASEDSAAAVQTADEAKEIAQQAASGVIGNGAVTWEKLASAVQQMITDLQSGLSALTSRVGGAETAISTNAGALNNLTDTVDEIDTTVSNLSTTVSSQGGRITSQGNTINQQANQIGDLATRVGNLEESSGSSADTTDLVNIGADDREDGVTIFCRSSYKTTRGMAEIFLDFYPKNTGGSFTTLFTLPASMRPSQTIVMPVWILNTNEGTASNRYVEVNTSGEVGYASQGAGEYNRIYWYITFPVA